MAVKTKYQFYNRNNCSCSMPGVWRAMAYCHGAVVIFHSPKACAHIINTMDVSGYYRTWGANAKYQETPIPLLTSQLQEKHAIFGGIEELERCVRFAMEEYHPQCLVIANSCVAGVIGDNVEDLAASIRQEYGIHVIAINAYGFLDGEYFQGYFDTANKLLDEFCKVQEHIPRTVVLIGDHDGPSGNYAQEVTRMLHSLGIKVLCQFPGYLSVEEMETMTSAEASIVLGSRSKMFEGYAALATRLEEEYGVKAVQGVFPLGMSGTRQWLEAIGELFDVAEEAQELIQEEAQGLEQRMQRYLPVTRGHKVSMCLGRLLSNFDPQFILEIITHLELDLASIVLLEDYESREFRELQQVMAQYTQAHIYSYRDEAGSEALAQAELILTTHELKGLAVKQLFLPLFPKVAQAGIIDLMETIYRTISSKVKHGGIIYVK